MAANYKVLPKCIWSPQGWPLMPKELHHTVLDNAVRRASFYITCGNAQKSADSGSMYLISCTP